MSAGVNGDVTLARRTVGKVASEFQNGRRCDRAIAQQGQQQHEGCKIGGLSKASLDQRIGGVGKHEGGYGRYHCKADEISLAQAQAGLSNQQEHNQKNGGNSRCRGEMRVQFDQFEHAHAEQA